MRACFVKYIYIVSQISSECYIIGFDSDCNYMICNNNGLQSENYYYLILFQKYNIMTS